MFLLIKKQNKILAYLLCCIQSLLLVYLLDKMIPGNWKLLHPTLLFNNIPLSNNLFEKNLDLTLDIKLNFSEHIKSITKKISKTMGLLRKSQQILSRSSLLTICKTFIRSRLDYADMTKLIIPFFMINLNLSGIMHA